jgi:ATP-dependent RNA helicase RhlE
VAHSRALSVAPVYGGVGIQAQARKAAKAHIVVATPGRLEDLLRRGDLRLDRIQMLVIDEADRMLDMGFKPALDRIVAQVPGNRQTLFFSATLEGEAGRQAKAYTHDARRHVHAPTEQRKADIEHRFVHVAHEAKLDALVSELGHESCERTLVFVRTKRGADRLVKRLDSAGVRAVAMHGNKTQSQRQKALARFESGHVSTLVATDVAARGIDVPDVTHVINFDAPEDREGYVHRVGRTGRAGRKGAGVSFVIADQVRDMRRIAHDLDLLSQFDDGAPAHVTGSDRDITPRRKQGNRPSGGKRSANGNRPSGNGRSKPRGKSRRGGGGGHEGGGEKPATVASASPRGRRRGR